MNDQCYILRYLLVALYQSYLLDIFWEAKNIFIFAQLFAVKWNGKTQFYQKPGVIWINGQFYALTSSSEMPEVSTFLWALLRWTCQPLPANFFPQLFPGMPVKASDLICKPVESSYIHKQTGPIDEAQQHVNDGLKLKETTLKGSQTFPFK